MRVLYIPYYDSNDYQDLLSSSVAEEGVEPVAGERSLAFSLTRNVVGKDIDLVHLIWTDPFFLVEDFTGNRRIDAVASSVLAALFLLNLLVVRLCGVPFVWTVHNKRNHEGRCPRTDLFVNRVLSRIVAELTVECERAKAIITDLFEVDDPDKVHVVREGSYIGSYPNEVGHEEAKARLGMAPDELSFVYFGMVRGYKNVPELIRTFDACDLDATLHVAGNPKTDALATAVADAAADADDVTTRLEFVPNDEVQYYMNGADIVVLPYEDILTSGSVLLAMSFGRPVVAPDLGCIPAIADPSRNFIYSPNTSEALAAALGDAAVTPKNEREAIGDRNYERAESLRWSTIGTETVRIYEQAIARA